MEELIREARQGDAEAFTRLMRSQMQAMYKVARAILDEEEDVADAIAETILTCWEKLGQLKDPAFFCTWMTRILINKCKDILRKKRKVSFMAEVPEIAVHDDAYENAEWKGVLESLGERYRLVMVLYYVEGFQAREIGEILELPESTVRTRLARGRQYLAQELAGRERRR